MRTRCARAPAAGPRVVPRALSDRRARRGPQPIAHPDAEVVKCRAFRLEPHEEDALLDLDGEVRAAFSVITLACAGARPLARARAAHALIRRSRSACRLGGCRAKLCLASGVSLLHVPRSDVHVSAAGCPSQQASCGGEWM